MKAVSTLYSLCLSTLSIPTLLSYCQGSIFYFDWRGHLRYRHKVMDVVALATELARLDYQHLTYRAARLTLIVPGAYH